MDIAIIGNIDLKLAAQLRTVFSESNLPYFFDIVDYQKVSIDLKDNIDKCGVRLL